MATTSQAANQSMQIGGTEEGPLWGMPQSFGAFAPPSPGQMRATGSPMAASPFQAAMQNLLAMQRPITANPLIPRLYPLISAGPMGQWTQPFGGTASFPPYSPAFSPFQLMGASPYADAFAMARSAGYER